LNSSTAASGNTVLTDQSALSGMGEEVIGAITALMWAT